LICTVRVYNTDQIFFTVVSIKITYLSQLFSVGSDLFALVVITFVRWLTSVVTEQMWIGIVAGFPFLVKVILPVRDTEPFFRIFGVV